MTALAWISCSAQTTGAQNRVNVVERAASGSSYHVPLPARHELACAQRQPRSVRRAMIARRARRALGLGRWALGDSGLRRPGPGFVIIIHSLPLMSGPQSNLISDIHEIGTLFTTHPHKNQRRERQRERGAGAGGRAGAAARGTAALTLYTGALLSLRGGGGAPLQGPGSPGSRSSFSARLRLACFCSLRNWSAAAASHSGSSAASAASAAFAAAAGSGGGRCAINSLPHSGHRTTVRFFCKLTPSVALHRGHEKLEGWGGGLGFLGFGGASTSSGLACRRSMDVSTKWSISASGVRQLRATGCAARAKPMHASYLQFDEFDARGLRVGNALDHVCGHTNASAAMGPPHAGGLFSPALR